MENEEDMEYLGFGAVDRCQAGVGISCNQCIYVGVCTGDDEDGTW